MVFLAILGESPGVLTETLWALISQNAGNVPDHISVMTTRKGREILQREVLDSGAWERLSSALQPVRPLPFPQIVRMPRRDSADEMVDVMSREDVEHAGDHMLRWVRGFAAEPATRLCASISGGRKSMTMLFTTCMTLLGKPGDRMCHVHVPSPYDSPLSPPFLFPGGAERHQTPDGCQIQGRKVPVTLIDIPFIPLHGLYEHYWGQSPAPLSHIIESLHPRLVSPPCGKIQLQRRKKILKLDDTQIQLSQQELRLLEYMWGLKSFPEGWSGLPPDVDAEDARKAAERVRQKLKKAQAPLPEITRILPRFRTDPRPTHWPPKGLRIL